MVIKNSLRHISRHKKPLTWTDFEFDIDEYCSEHLPIHSRCERRCIFDDYTTSRPFYYIEKTHKDLITLSGISICSFHDPCSGHVESNLYNTFMRDTRRKKMKLNNIMNTPMVKELERKMLSQCVNKIKTTFGVQMDINYNREDYIKFLGWVKKHDKSFRKHITKCPYKPHYFLKDQDLILKVGEHTYARILTGNAIQNTFDEVERYDNNKRASIDFLTVRIYIFGKEAKKVAYRLEKMRNRECLEFFTVTVSKETRNSVNVYRDLATGRNKDSVFLNDHIKDDILNHVRKFFSNKEIYDKRNLTYKTGILLEGEPGTGKSTIASMIATEFNISMVIINMNQFAQLDTDFITSTLNADDKTYVVLLEDIDCVIGDRESEDSDVENKKNVNKLLQFLDSASSPSNVIFVATTNHIEKLDDAIVRDGRFDLKVNISNINREVATHMCKSFGIKDEATITRLFEENNRHGKINPAKLQNLILKEIDN